MYHPIFNTFNPIHSLVRLGILSSLCTACIAENPTSPLLEGEAGEEQAGLTAMGGDVQAGDVQAGETTAGETTAGEAQAGEAQAGEALAGEIQAGEVVAGEVMDPPPAPDDLPPCERFCQRAEDCLYPVCEAISAIPPSQFCRNWCRNGDADWLDQGADLSCVDFNRRVYGFSPELRTLCESDPAEDPCDVICEFGAVCGVVSSECTANCQGADTQAQLCFRSAADAGDCRRFTQCFGQMMQPRDPERAYQEACTGICEREALCVFDACAPGTVDSSDVMTCVTECVAERPTQEELVARYQLTCGEVVDQILSENVGLGERCALSEDEFCSTLCSERVVSCGQIDNAECEQRCSTWDDANYLCLQQAISCEEVDVCLISEEDQDFCRRSCDHLQGCLEAACPPRIIPPSLTDRCTANCFANPISEEDLLQWEATECRQVREVVYQDNPQLRPICEGNQDFRPSPEECTAFCEDGLDDCILGGMSVCLSACASFEREQYACALEAQGVCAQMDQCF